MIMANLFQIDQAILECVDLETGEIVDLERLQDLAMEKNAKIENTALWYKNLLSDAAQYKEQKDYFADLEKKAKKKAESLKAYLFAYLAGEKFETVRTKISFTKSEQTIVDNLKVIPEEFLKYSDPAPDLTALKKAIKEGREIEGVHIEEKKNIQIK